MEALRFNEGKPRWSMFRKFDNAIVAVIRVLERGAIKYEEDNWLKGGKPDSEYTDACDRHIQLHLEGQLYDSDTGCLHLAHAAWNILAMLRLNYHDVAATAPDFDEEAYRARYARKCPIEEIIDDDFTLEEAVTLKARPVQARPVPTDLHHQIMLRVLGQAPYPDGLRTSDVFDRLQGTPQEIAWPAVWEGLGRMHKEGWITRESPRHNYRLTERGLAAWYQLEATR